MICKRDIPEDQQSREHVPPEAIGTAFVIHCVCKQCNSELGHELDAPLSRVLRKPRFDAGLVERIEEWGNIEGRRVRWQREHRDIVTLSSVVEVDRSTSVDGEPVSQRFSFPIHWSIDDIRNHVNHTVEKTFERHSMPPEVSPQVEIGYGAHRVEIEPHSEHKGVLARGLAKIGLEAVCWLGSVSMANEAVFDCVRGFIAGNEASVDGEILAQSDGRWLDITASTHIILLIGEGSAPPSRLHAVISLFEGTIEANIVLAANSPPINPSAALVTIEDGRVSARSVSGDGAKRLRTHVHLEDWKAN